MQNIPTKYPYKTYHAKHPIDNVTIYAVEYDIIHIQNIIFNYDRKEKPGPENELLNRQKATGIISKSRHTSLAGKITIFCIIN
jgi:hypothetical protein